MTMSCDCIACMLRVKVKHCKLVFVSKINLHSEALFEEQNSMLYQVNFAQFRLILRKSYCIAS